MVILLDKETDLFSSSKLACEKCKRVFDTNDITYWQRGVKFEGIDRHHNPPEEISKFLKEKWSGEFFDLCRKCHIDLHGEITTILKKYSNKPKYNADYWLMMYSIPLKIKEAQKEIYEFTKEWINGN